MDLIIGAGISGLSYANFCNHHDYLIIDQDSEIGGYCKTVKKEGFTWDYSGHFFHFRFPEIKEYIFKEMNRNEILEVVKNAQIYYKGSYIDFPFQKNIHQLEKEEFIDCLFDLFTADKKAKSSSFKEMVIQNFGKSIADKFLIPYNEKLYACNLDELDVDAMGRFFPHADKEQIIKNFRQPENNYYNNTFTYPKGGAIEYVKSLYKRIEPTSLSLSEKLLRIDVENKTAITDKRKIKFTNLISSIPFNRLLDCCGINYDKTIYTWNKVLVFNIGFDKKGNDRINNWVYFPDKDYIFYRIGYYDNIFNDERLSLYIEIGFPEHKTIDVEHCFNEVINDLQKANIIQDHKVIAYHSVIMDPAYVHVNKKADLDKTNKMAELNKNGIYSIGRYGDWKYCSIEDNIVESKNLAEKLN